MADPRDYMFRSYDDMNNVDTSCNSHDEIEFEPPPSQLKPVEPRYRYVDGQGFSQVPPPDSLVERTRERVMNAGRASMIFEGDSKCRAERIPLDRAVSERADGLPWPALPAEEATRREELAGIERPTQPTQPALATSAPRARRRY